MMKIYLPLLFATLISASLIAQREVQFELKFDEDGIEKYTKAEIGIKLPSLLERQINKFISDNNTGVNPYDPEQIDVTSTWTAPSGKTQKVNGFYYKKFIPRSETSWKSIPTKYSWLLRWAPDELGDWKVEISISTEGDQWSSKQIQFTCIDSNRKGYLARNPSKPNGTRYFYQHDSPKPFFAIGHNIAHSHFNDVTPKSAQTHQQWIQDLAAGKGNFWRLEMGSGNFVPSDKDCKNYTSKLEEMTELDDLIEVSAENGCYFITFRHHVEIEDGASWSRSKWETNGYKTSLGLTSRKEYYTNEEAIKWQLNELRYIMARWGYSPAFSFYGYSEIDGWIKDLQKEEGLSDVEAMAIFVQWFKTQKEFIGTELGISKMMFANTFASSGITKECQKKDPENTDILLYSDMVGYHQYGVGKETNIERRSNDADFYQKKYDAPTIMEECGFDLPHIYCASDCNFFQTVWSSTFFGDFGTGMHYWWSRGIQNQGMCKLYEPLANFIEKIDFRDNYSPSHDFKGSVRKSRIAYTALVNDNSKTAYGFIHDPAYYWRNMKSENVKIKQLLDEGKMKDPCILEDGTELGVPLSNEIIRYNAPRYEDAYTEHADESPLSSDSYPSQPIKLRGLDSSGLFGKRKTFLIQYHDPRDPNLKVLHSETVKAKRNGTIKLSLNESTWPAAAFSVTLKN